MRALLLVLDSAGCGPAPDLAASGDAAANTLGRIFSSQPGLELPALFSLGLWKIVTGDVFDRRSRKTIGSYGRVRACSAGQDTTAGHWEMAGVIQEHPFAVHTTFPPDLVQAIERDARVQFLGNYAQNSVAILEELGAEHLRTGRPLLFTGADSVMQIAAHESVVARRKLYEICRIARRHADAWRIRRVIARPFTGEPGAFQPTAGRHDFSAVPPRTVLNAIAERGLRIEGVGKISNIFSGSGITRSIATTSDTEGLAAIDALWSAGDDGLIFANLADFGTLHGDRREGASDAAALIAFDRWLETFLKRCQRDDLLIITADHGSNPTRQEVPLMVLHGGQRNVLGTRSSFADIAASLAAFFRLPAWPVGQSVLRVSR